MYRFGLGIVRGSSIVLGRVRRGLVFGICLIRLVLCILRIGGRLVCRSWSILLGLS